VTDFLGLLALADVLVALLVVQHPTIAGAVDSGGVLHPDDCAVVPAESHFEPPHGPFALHQGLPPLAILRVHIQRHRVGGQQRLPVRVAQHLYQGQVHVEELPCRRGAVESQ